MLARTALSFANAGVLGATLAVWFLLPQYSTYALYGCLGWVVVAFGLMYSPWGNRRIRGTGSDPGTTGASVRGAALAGAPLDFCIYCAAQLPTAARRCPACGHALARG